MKKICHLSSVHPRFDTRIFYKECSSLAKAGYDVSLIISDSGKYEIKNGVKIYGLKKQKSKLRRMLITPSALFKKAISLNADIYHLHDPELIPIGLKLKKLGKKVVFDSHEDISSQILTKPYLNKLLLKLISKFYKVYENYSLSKMDLIITPTDYIYMKFNSWHNNVISVKNYPILEEFNFNHKNIRNNPKNNNILYLGGITKIRGIYELIKSLEYCNVNVRLKLAGQFDDSPFKRDIINLEGWKKVDYLGYLNRNEISKLVEKVCLGVVTLHLTPNYINALPVKMFEYMTAGLPVISSNFPLWKTVVKGSNCGVCVDPTDPKAIAQAIDWIINHPKEAHLMGINGLNAIKKFYNWKNEEKKLIEAYKSLY